MMIKHAVILFLMLTKHVAIIIYERSIHIHLNVVARDHDNFTFLLTLVFILILRV